MGQRMGTALLLVALGENMAIYEEEEEEEDERDQMQGLYAVCGRHYQHSKTHSSQAKTLKDGMERVAGEEMRPGERYWEEFHTCAVAALWECQREAATIWEMLKKESRKIKFQGSLFDLCASSNSQNFSSLQIPSLSLLSITLMVTWLNL
uniref:neuritin-like isoform X2 n=1 Tax=Podarcis muralis TaxID=64176 RepID=UPI00109F465A|nr:neuritin-like isoform X2 [Podarcis muralis]